MHLKHHINSGIYLTMYFLTLVYFLIFLSILPKKISSGQPNDVEERIIGLGLPAGLFRMAVTMHPYGALLVSRDISETADYFNLLEMIVANSPVFSASAILSKVQNE